jgi:hypothetical protein
VRRLSADGRTALVVVHAFEFAPKEVHIPLPGGWKITAQLSASDLVVATNAAAESLHLAPLREFDAAIVLLSRTA